MSRIYRVLSVLIFYVVVVESASSPSSEIFLKWLNFEFSLVTNTTWSFRGRISIAGRVEMIADTCAYDALAPYSIAKPWITQGLPRRILRSPSSMDRSISYAIYRCLIGVFNETDPQFLPLLDEFFEVELNYDKSYTAKTPLTAAGIGNMVADQVLRFYKNDGTNAEGNEPNTNPSGTRFGEYTNFVIHNDPMQDLARTNCSQVRSVNHWQEIKVVGANGQPVVQKWLDQQFTRYKRFFGLTGASQYRAEPPPLYGTPSEPEYNAIFDAVIEHTANLTDYNKVLAEYWAYHTVRQRRLCISTAQLNNMNLDETVKLMFVASQACHETNLANWDDKRYYMFVRPFLAIPCTKAGQQFYSFKGPYKGVGLINASDFTTYLPKTIVTFPDAEYPSGKASVCGWFAELMRLWFGDDVYRGPPSWTVAAGGTVLEPAVFNSSDPRYVAGLTDVANTGPMSVGYAPAAPVTLTWNTWTEMEQQCAASRVYLGIHTPLSVQRGLLTGHKVTQSTWVKATSLWFPPPPWE